MGPSERQQNAISLEALLTEEREAILAANFEGLERISSEKERLTQAIGADSVDEKTLAKLRDQWSLLLIDTFVGLKIHGYWELGLSFL